MFSRLGEGASTIRKLLFCLLARIGPIFNAFTNGKVTFGIRKNIFACCVPVSPLTFSRTGEGASTIHKKRFSNRRRTSNASIIKAYN